MALDLYYGLRNLSVGDEEETRIADMIDDIDDPRLRQVVTLLVEMGEYTAAYEIAIRQEFLRRSMTLPAGLPREHVEAAGAAWVAQWNDEQGHEGEDALTIAELMAIYDDIMVRR